MKQKNKIITGILLFTTIIIVICLRLYFNCNKNNSQQLLQGNYVEVDNSKSYFNLNLNEQTIEYYDGEEYFQSNIQFLNKSILTTKIAPFGKCILVAENRNINLIMYKNNDYVIVVFSFRGPEFIKIEHH